MSEQANTTAAAEVSSEYLSDIRLRVRSSVDKLTGRIKDLILAARAVSCAAASSRPGRRTRTIRS